ncbi:MAG: NusG domain II-containing protein [Chlorobi bacterium]|nr:NusG domain II-containing protein [Chlorobiota bacterium]
MNRRQFFRSGFFNIGDLFRQRTPEPIRPKKQLRHVDLTVLTDAPDAVEEFVNENVREFFGEHMLRLRQSVLHGDFPGGILLFENDRLRDHRDGISLFFAALRTMEEELDLRRMHHDPTLVRYSNFTPPMSNAIEIYHRDTVVRRAPLHESATFEVEGSLGPVSVKIENGKFSITDAACRHKICVAHPPIITPGQRITCLPNEITVVVKGDGN